ncbi:hypothetical protein [Pontibacter chinhatensis]|uniref:hypothetical protein n=1 Tax=Pontibacter chinhatensis TaxID=1436961 RepID=UPI001587F58E|nr:hypothetical protein [Pontibacter chinhatensis]
MPSNFWSESISTLYPFEAVEEPPSLSLKSTFVPSKKAATGEPVKAELELGVARSVWPPLEPVLKSAMGSVISAGKGL